MDISSQTSSHDLTQQTILKLQKQVALLTKQITYLSTNHGMENVVLLSGNSNVKLAKQIGKKLNLPVDERNIPAVFANSELRCRVHQNLRGKDIFIIQTGCTNPQKKMSINDIILETLIMIDACRRSMASTVTVIMPNYPYARGDKKDLARSPIPAKTIANLFEAVKVDRFISLDLHATQIQGYMDVPFDNLYSVNLVVNCLQKNLFKNMTLEERQAKYVMVSPDAGAVKRTLSFSDRVKLNMMIMHKQRNYIKANTVDKTILIQEGGNKESMKTKTAIICDDIADTCGTLVSAIKSLENYGITKVICVITHGVFSRDALDKINNCENILEFYVSDSIPQEENQRKCPKLKVFTISSLLSEVIKRIITKDSISELFRPK